MLELAERQENRLESFLSLVKVAGLEERLTDAGDVTLFAPTDAAFRGRSRHRDLIYIHRDGMSMMMHLLS